MPHYRADLKAIVKCSCIKVKIRKTAMSRFQSEKMPKKPQVVFPARRVSYGAHWQCFRRTSKFLKKMYLYSCIRERGCTLEFTHVKDNKYQCAQCRKHGKMRSVTIVNGSIVSGNVHPEDGHHALCKPAPETGIQSSVRPFVPLSVCHTPVSCRNCRMHQFSFVNVLLTTIVRPIL